MPGLRVIRPADANETAAAWRVAVDSDGPTALILSRQDLPVLDGTAELAAEGVGRGAYVLEPRGAVPSEPDLVLIGTGSEVQHCTGAAALLAADGVNARVVSFPSWDLFSEQEAGYRDRVLPPGIPRLAVEAGAVVRLGALRRRDGLHRPFRGVGSGLGEHGEIRLHRRQRRRAAPGSCCFGPTPNSREPYDKAE